MKPLILFLAVLPVFSVAQQVKVNEYDRFTKQRRVELNPLRIYNSGSANVSIAYTATGPVLYLQISGVGWGASAIDEGQEMIFLFANDSTVTVRSTEVQTSEMNSSFQPSFRHSYFVRMPDLKLLSEHEVIGIRKYGLGNQFDLKVTKDNAVKLQKLSALFLEELKIANIFRPVQEININDITKHIGDSVKLCTKVYSTRYFESVQNKPTVLDVNPSHVSKLNIIIWEQDRKNFPTAPETLYNNKEVCVIGVVQSYNNIPQIVVRNRDQISIKSALDIADAGNFIGDSITISGKVSAAANPGNSAATPTILSMSGSSQGETLTVIIDNKSAGGFPASPENYYLNRDISVRGKLEMIQGKPQIVVQNKSQIVELPFQPRPAETKPQQPVQSVAKPETSAPEVPYARSGAMERTASFPGGQDALLDFLRTNIVTPEDELRVGEKKVVIAKFMIEPDGTASDIQITQPGGMSFDKEVIRVLRLMPKWEPQLTNGNPVPVTVTQPITFVRGETNAKRRARS